MSQDVEKYALVFGTTSEIRLNDASPPTSFIEKFLIKSFGVRTTDSMTFGCLSTTLSKTGISPQFCPSLRRSLLAANGSALRPG